MCYGKIQSSYPDQNVYIVGEKTSYRDLCNAFTNGGWYEQASIAKVHSYDCGGCPGSRIDEHSHLAHLGEQLCLRRTLSSRCCWSRLPSLV